MKLTLLILTLLTMFIFNVGCATLEGQPDYLGSMFKSQDASTYQNNQVKCTTVQQGTDWYGNPIVRTVCNQ